MSRKQALYVFVVGRFLSSHSGLRLGLELQNPRLKIVGYFLCLFETNVP